MKTNACLRRLLLCLALAAGPAHAALEWDKKEIAVDVRRGTQDYVNAKFEFKNTGRKPVTLLGISTSCGCTTAYPDSSTVGAGKKSNLWASFTIGQRTGLQEKKITIATDDPDNPEVVLTLRINILEPGP